MSAPNSGDDHRCLAGRHPVVVAAHGVDFAVVADEPVGVREPPGREGVGRKALVDERERGLEILDRADRCSRRRAAQARNMPL